MVYKLWLWLACRFIDAVGFYDRTYDDKTDVSRLQGKFPAGPLYTGPSTICFERWRFWSDRFDKLCIKHIDNDVEMTVSLLDTHEQMGYSETDWRKLPFWSVIDDDNKITYPFELTE
jgi:hypothetical protein